MNRINNLNYKLQSRRKSRKKKKIAENLRKSKNVDKNSAATKEKQSKSEEKLKRFNEHWRVEDLNENTQTNYILAHKDQLPNFVKNQLCSSCNANALDVTVSDPLGFASKITVQCTMCQEVAQTFYTSPNVDGSMKKPFHVNKKLVEAITMMGLGYAGLQRFCLSMNMSIMSRSTFHKIVHELNSESHRLKKEMLSAAREQVRQHYLAMDETLCSDSIIDYTTSYDGTWQKRGYSSLYGIGIVIELYTGLVIDYHILSKFCRACIEKQRTLGENSDEFNEWQRLHKNKFQCQQNFDDSSGAMEAYAAEILWKRSIKNCNARYINVLSDGDAKTFSHLNEIQAYGPDHPLIREQCINHVSKGFITGLRNLVKDCAVKKITLGGRKPGSLTAKVMLDLGVYYRNAIVHNSPNVHLMQTGILATLEHYNSTDSEPTHHMCPSGSDSWCWYNKALAKKEKPPSHNTRKAKINGLVIEHIRPIYNRFSNIELLQRCVRGGTQNANESLHHMIWSRCRKETFQSKQKLETAVIFAVSEFNMGCEHTHRLFSSIQGENPSLDCTRISSARDSERKRKSLLMDQASTKKTRKRRKHALKAQDKKKRRLEGPSYAPGGFVEL